MPSNDIFWKHRVRIAKDTLKMSDEGALMMGGMTKEDARWVLREDAKRKKEKGRTKQRKHKLRGR